MSAAPTRSCPSCNLSYPGFESFCHRCGARLQDVVSPPIKDELVGRILGDRYVLERRLGEGGMGFVYRARHKLIERKFAVKLLHKEVLRDPRARERFVREARATAALDHPNVVRLYDYGTTPDNEPYLVMEFLEGDNLFNVLEESPEHRLPLSQAVDVTMAIARVLAYAHAKGIVHRDIKLENILLTQRDGIADWPVLLDFGIASIIDLPPLTRIGKELLGTIQYLAPESLAGPAKPPMDLYAVGVLLHELIVGHPPFEGELMAVLQQHATVIPPLLSERTDVKIPDALDRLVARLLEKKPEARPSATETADALQEIRAKLPPRSLRGLMLAKTFILNRGSHQAARTVVLPSSLAPTTLLPGKGGVPLAERSTMLVSALVRQVDETEETLARLAASLSSRIGELGMKLWGSAWPEDAAALRRALTGSETRLEEMELDMALLLDRIREQEAALHHEEELHRSRFLELGEHLDDDTIPQGERMTIEEARRRVEREMHQSRALDQRLQHQRDALAGAVQALRAELHGHIRLLCRRMAETIWPRALQEDQRHLREDLVQFESALGMAMVLARVIKS